jgi:hypothetical protein
LASWPPATWVTVTRIDRLARSTERDLIRTRTAEGRSRAKAFDLFAIVKRIVDAKAQFRSPPFSRTYTDPPYITRYCGRFA